MPSSWQHVASKDWHDAPRASALSAKPAAALRSAPKLALPGLRSASRCNDGTRAYALMRHAGWRWTPDPNTHSCMCSQLSTSQCCPSHKPSTMGLCFGILPGALPKRRPCHACMHAPSLLASPNHMSAQSCSASGCPHASCMPPHRTACNGARWTAHQGTPATPTPVMQARCCTLLGRRVQCCHPAPLLVRCTRYHCGPQAVP